MNRPNDTRDWRQHPVTVYRIKPEHHAQLLEDRGAGLKPAVPTSHDTGTRGHVLNTIRMRDGATYAIFSDGSFHRVPRRRRFRLDTGAVLSGRQLRIIRKRAQRAIKAEQAAGTQSAS